LQAPCAHNPENRVPDGHVPIAVTTRAYGNLGSDANTAETGAPLTAVAPTEPFAPGC
jgi:hypothetical protein